MPRKKLTEEEEIARVKAMYEYEHNCRDNGYTVVAGVDEAGRGPLAGPVYAAAVILPNDIIIKGINDSKKLSEKKREELFEEITEKAIAYNIFSVDEKRIDEINILNATYEAMNGAVNGLSTAPDFVLIDGNRISGMEIPHETVVKGDSKSISIAAASILAKVSRDRFICQMAEKYPEYVKKIDEAGHEIGTHSKTHPYMSKLSESEIREELSSSSGAITAVTGKKVELFRPPYGDYDNLLIDTSNSMGLYPIQWDVDSLDWKNLSATDIAMRIINGVKPGSIILCHNNGLHTAEALPLIFSTLQNRGYEFVPIGELIYRENYAIDSAGKQYLKEAE